MNQNNEADKAALRKINAKAARMLVPKESAEQIALIQWFDMQYKGTSIYGRLAACPNAAMVPAYVGQKMNREGRRKGFPDLMLLTPRHGFHGLVIELKRAKGGSLTEEQSDWIAWLRAQGYLAAECKGFEQAKKMIEEYLGNDLTVLNSAY